jgi:nucleoside-diphosphate kinase
MTQRTLAIIKPDAVSRGLIGRILSVIEEGGLRLAAMKMVHLSRTRAEAFYQVHRERDFFAPLVDFMSEGPVVVMVLEAEDVIERWRRLMGATDPAEAAEGTLRRNLGENIRRNCVHGSDAPGTAAFEISFFFGEGELLDA